MDGEEFSDVSEDLWQSWLRHDEIRLAESLAPAFDLGACPEPYLTFDAGANPLVILTTNPGGTMGHQTYASIEGGSSPIRPSMSYRDVADLLGVDYPRVLAGKPAATRIAAQMDLATLGGYAGVLQVETIPFHSPNLPTKYKNRMIADWAGEPYVEALTKFIAARPTVVLSAVSSRTDLMSPPALSRWLSWQADLIGLDVPSAAVVPLVHKERRVTCAAFIDRAGPTPRALVLMMGGNYFPGPDGRERLAEAISEG